MSLSDNCLLFYLLSLEMRSSGSFRFRSLRVAGIVVLLVLAGGTLGYMLTDQLPFLDALYTTVTMMTTVGDVPFPLSLGGRTFSILIMIVGIGSLLYTFGVVMEFLLEGHLGVAVRRRLMDNKIMGLRGHYIICGFGRVGSRIAQELSEAHQPFVVLDERENSLQSCIALGYLAVEGDATTDPVLRAAGIEHAACLLVATDNDSTNISITLSARHLSPTLRIVARANRAETEVKLKLAGANQVLSPYTIAGHRMANLALKDAPAESPTLE